MYVTNVETKGICIRNMADWFLCTVPSLLNMGHFLAIAYCTVL